MLVIILICSLNCPYNIFLKNIYVSGIQTVKKIHNHIAFTNLKALTVKTLSMISLLFKWININGNPQSLSPTVSRSCPSHFPKQIKFNRKLNYTITIISQ